MIVGGKLSGCPFKVANSFGGPLEPSLIVAHDTAGRLSKGNSVSWFQNPECSTSAHFVVERDGSRTQMVRTDRRAWHAGKSFWRGRAFCNSFALGIEIVNPGKLDAAGRAWFGDALAGTGIPTRALVRKATKAHGDGWWLPYTSEQIASVKELCRELVEHYSDVNEIVTHWMISPGRKIDTNPLFPLEEVSRYALGQED